MSLVIIMGNKNVFIASNKALLFDIEMVLHLFMQSMHNSNAFWPYFMFSLHFLKYYWNILTDTEIKEGEDLQNHFKDQYIAFISIGELSYNLCEIMACYRWQKIGKKEIILFRNVLYIFVLKNCLSRHNQFGATKFKNNRNLDKQKYKVAGFTWFVTARLYLKIFSVRSGFDKSYS